MSTAETIRTMKMGAFVQGLVTADPGVSQVVNEALNCTFSDGTGANKAGNVLVYKNRSLNNTNEDINFTTALDFQGDAIGTAKIMGLYIKYETGDASTYMTVKQAASNGVVNIFDAAGHGVKIPVGGGYLATNVNGWTVTAATGDLLNIVTTCNATYTLVAVVQ